VHLPPHRHRWQTKPLSREKSALYDFNNTYSQY